MSKVCASCGSTDRLISWGCAFPEPQKVFICESCDEENGYKLEKAVLDVCPPGFYDNMSQAFDDFAISDRETDQIDVLWNLGDTIKDPFNPECLPQLFSLEHQVFETYEADREVLPLPTPQEFAVMVQAWIDALHPSSPRRDYMENDPNGSTDAMTWGFVEQLFKEGEN